MQAFKKYQIDIAILNETNIKWIPKKMDIIEQVLKQQYREVKVIRCDSSV